MTFEKLKEKAAGLPTAPGVYIMRDQTQNVIYVGKAKKLKNRVSQYFQDTANHSPKTRMMVSKINDFDVIVAASEFEALVLECSLIKRHMPKYNILLKDDKGYPYIRLNMKDPYPKLTMVSRVADDGANYYGPFGSRGVTKSLLDSICITLRLPSCNRTFPKDIGKGRPCLNYHMKQCDGWCLEGVTQSDYHNRIEQTKQLLAGNFRQVSLQLKSQMEQAAESLNFELAANLRDRLRSVEQLGQKQLVTAGTHADTDVIGFYQNAQRACFTVLHFSNGNLIDKEYEILSSVEEQGSAIASLLTQYYLNCGYAPRTVLLPIAVEDAELLEQLMEKQLNRRPKLHVPQRGDNVRLIEMANTNAKEEVDRITSKEEKNRGTVITLGKMLNISAPTRIEAFDISNISGTDIVASMVVFLDGRPKKGEYKRFSVQNMAGQDDYASMRQVVARRLTHLINGDSGFNTPPDLLLIDGGISHAQAAMEVLDLLSVSIPVFGMVKDNRHRTRALVAANGAEIRIDNNQAVFSLIGNIQEEAHRFAINYHRQLRSKRLRYSELDKIVGIGPKRKQALLKTFKTIAAIKAATRQELMKVLPKDTATSVYDYFHQERKE